WAWPIARPRCPASFRLANNSAWASPARWWPSRGCWWPTNRPATSIPPCRARSWRCSPRCPNAAPACWSPAMTWAWSSACASACWSSTMAAWSTTSRRRTWPMAEANARDARSGSQLGTWFDHHLYSLVASLGRVFREPGAALLTVSVMALALALPLGLWLVLGNVERLAGNVERSREISVFLEQDIDAARAVALADELRARANIGAVAHVTPEQGLATLREGGALAGIVDAVGEDNPLPHLLVVTPAGDELMVAASLEQLPEAALVQHDVQWRERLDTWLRFGGRVSWVLAVLLGLGALLVVGNTVRLDIQSRREEIGVLQLLGASDGFIRRPFLYLGAWYGLAAGA